MTKSKLVGAIIGVFAFGSMNLFADTKPSIIHCVSSSTSPYLRIERVTQELLIEHSVGKLNIRYATPTWSPYASEFKVSSSGVKRLDADHLSYTFKASYKDTLPGQDFGSKWKVNGELIFNPKDPAHSLLRRKTSSCDDFACLNPFSGMDNQADEEMTCTLQKAT